MSTQLSLFVFQRSKNADAFECGLRPLGGLGCHGPKAGQNWAGWQTPAEQARRGRVPEKYYYFFPLHFSAKTETDFLQEFLTCNGAVTTISCHGGNLGTSSRIGIGSMDATFAGTDAWIWSALTLPENTSFLKPLCAKVRFSSIYSKSALICTTQPSSPTYVIS